MCERGKNKLGARELARPLQHLPALSGELPICYKSIDVGPAFWVNSFMRIHDHRKLGRLACFVFQFFGRSLLAAFISKSLSVASLHHRPHDHRKWCGPVGRSSAMAETLTVSKTK